MCPRRGISLTSHTSQPHERNPPPGCSPNLYILLLRTHKCYKLAFLLLRCPSSVLTNRRVSHRQHVERQRVEILSLKISRVTRHKIIELTMQYGWLELTFPMRNIIIYSNLLSCFFKNSCKSLMHFHLLFNFTSYEWTEQIVADKFKCLKQSSTAQVTW